VDLLQRNETPIKRTRIMSFWKLPTAVVSMILIGTASGHAEMEKLGELNWGEQLAKGGTVVIILGILSVAGLGFALERLLALRRSNFIPTGFPEKADRLWEAGKYKELEIFCKRRGGILGQILAYAVVHRTAPLQHLETYAIDIGSRAVRYHQQRGYLLAVVATLAPLLGLMGTVIGMIEAFQTVAVAGDLGDASLLADSISKALVTTAVGLVVAVPALAAYHYFRMRTNQLGLILEEETARVFSDWFMSDIRKAHEQQPSATNTVPVNP